MQELKEENVSLPSTQRPQPILKARNLWFGYERHTPILKGIDLEIEKHLVTMILGLSGSGKTTLLKILARIIKPHQGEVELYNGSMDSPMTPLYRKGKSPDPKLNSGGIAYIPQSLGLVRNMTAWDNALMGALGYTGTVPSLFNRFSKKVTDEAHRIMTDLGIEDKLSRNVCELSGGERQRVAIARALMQNPDLILADEFVSQLDPVTTTDILEMMRKLTVRGISFLVTTHDIDLVVRYSDRVLVMREGTIVYDRMTKDLHPEEVLKHIK